MRRILEMRIVRWELKLAYVVGAYLVGIATAALLRVADLPDVSVSLVAFCIDIAAIMFGARVFRGKGEPVEPARVWWRMTSRPKLSWVLGILFLASSVWGAVSLVLGAFGVGGTMPAAADDPASTLSVIVELGVIAALYLNSAVRLRRLGVPAPEPKFRPTIRVKP